MECFLAKQLGEKEIPKIGRGGGRNTYRPHEKDRNEPTFPPPPAPIAELVWPPSVPTGEIKAPFLPHCLRLRRTVRAARVIDQ